MSTETYATATGGNGSTRPGTAAAMGTATTGARRAGPVPAPGRPATGPLTWSGNGTTEPYSPPRIASPPEPRLRQLIGVCGWAAVLGGIGLVVGVRGFIGILASNPPGWYEPSMIIFGALGIGATVVGYLTVHQNRTPWISLAVASFILVLSMIATSIAF